MRLQRIIFIALVLCLLAGCGGVPTEKPSVGITFTDDLGREVTVDRPQRVAALIGSFADIWRLAGGEEVLVAAAHDTWTSFDWMPGEGVADLGAIKEPNLELLMAQEPDLVLASSNTGADVELLDTLVGNGLNVAYFKVTNFDEYLHMLEICTQLTGREENFTQYGQALEEKRQAALSRIDGSRPTVLYVRATGVSCKVKNSRDSVLGEMLSELGCVNIADSDASILEELSMEAILLADPDYIFIVIQGSDPSDARALLDETLLSDPAWRSLTAVKEGRCYEMDPKLYNLKPNARWGEAYEGLAELLYP